MPLGKNSGGQAALEYLITYGWALVAIVTIIGVLVLSGGNVNSNTCTTFLTILCKGIDADGDQLMMVLQNATGQKITINPFTDIAFDGQYGYAKITYQGQEYRFEDVTIGAGDEFTITAEGMVLTNEMEITYREQNTGFTRTITSNMGTSAPDDTELSNNGEDDDGDNLTDCEDGMTNCEYVVTATFDSTTIAGETRTIKIPRPTGLEGPFWRIKEVTITFYIDGSPPANTKSVLTDPDNPPSTITGENLKSGFNYITLDMTGNEKVLAAGNTEFTLQSDGAPFTVNSSNNEVFWIINES